jgi:integrase
MNDLEGSRDYDLGIRAAIDEAGREMAMGRISIFAVTEIGWAPLTGPLPAGTLPPAVAPAVLTVAAFSPASAQAKPDSPAITVESLTPMVVEPLPALLQFSPSDIKVAIATAQPKRRRKGRKSMSRRSGQNGTVVIQSGWYRVRWRMDVEGQEERTNVSEKVAPVVFDKDGRPKPPSQHVRRLAREIVERSGANSEQRFNRVVLGMATFREQAKIYLRWVETRDREPIKDTSSIEAALNKWILPEIGDLPLANVNNITVKPLATKLKKSLSAYTVNKYVEYVKQVVASVKDGETGEPIHPRKWDSTVMDLPVVKQKEQRRPALKAKTVNQLVQESERDEQALYIIEGATGMRISEALALEKKHFMNNCRTICVRQQVDRDTPRIVEYLKTDAAFREIDVSEEVAEYLRAFLAGKEGLLLKTRNGTPYLHNSLKVRWLVPRLKAMGLDERGLGWHGFRRFRKTWLRGKRVQEDINNFWMGHKPTTMSELYSRLDEELELRLAEAEAMGVGFEIPIAPKCSETSEELELELESQEQ